MRAYSQVTSIIYIIQPKTFEGEKCCKALVPLYCRNILRILFAFNTVKVTISFMRKIHGYKFSPVRAGGKNGENFLLVKISGYTVLNMTLNI